MDIGHLIEGVVEQDPLTDRYVIRVERDDGTFDVFDPQEAMKAYLGQEVRLTLVTFQTLEELEGLLRNPAPQQLPSV